VPDEVIRRQVTAAAAAHSRCRRLLVGGLDIFATGAS